MAIYLGGHTGILKSSNRQIKLLNGLFPEELNSFISQGSSLLFEMGNG